MQVPTAAGQVLQLLSEHGEQEVPDNLLPSLQAEQDPTGSQVLQFVSVHAEQKVPDKRYPSLQAEQVAGPLLHVLQLMSLQASHKIIPTIINRNNFIIYDFFII